MPQLRANNCDFYYELSGSGAPIVLIHGESHSVEIFDHQIPALSTHYQCLTYDRRGHGKSQVAPYGHSLWNQTQDLRCILDALGIDRAIVVAVAMSTTIAATFARHYPARVRALALCSWYELDGYPALEERRKTHQMSFADLHLLMQDILNRNGRAGLEQYLEEHYTTLLPIMPPNKPEVRKKLIEIFSCHQPAHYSQTGEFYTSIPPLTAALKELACPILGICGTEDPSQDKPELFAQMPNFQQAWIKGARRFTMVEYPIEFNQILQDFLGGLKD
jgi:3-oxoadipate enol-lactonase